MWRISIRPEWFLSRPVGDPLPLPTLLRLLAAIQGGGSIADAARATRMSYRGAWGLLRDFEREFRMPLVIKARGQGTRLSPLADKLLWADRRVTARLSPTLDSLSSELEAELESLLVPSRSSFRIRSSFGYAVAALVEALGRQGVIVDLKYRNSTEAVAALARGECDLAGFHVAEGEFQERSLRPYLASFDARHHLLIQLAHRNQGLIVARGNPKGVHAVTDLARPEIRFVNRQIGSGTRMLFDLLLAQEKVDPATVAGYDSTEFTHAAVAAYIASGMADAGFGLEIGARRFNLDFVPLLRERYFFACEQAAIERPALRNVVRLLRSREMREIIDALPGYDSRIAGRVVTLDEAFSA
ncbi:MAG TPA: substrate-binding domain-containing protein [Burkholderiaceae bacterium]|nr:substrate-binding domain-containing protein [Burkholderiaceae bacterium]